MNQINSRFFILCTLLVAQSYSSFLAMDPSIKEQIETARTHAVNRKLEHMPQCHLCKSSRPFPLLPSVICHDDHQIDGDYLNQLEEIVTNAGPLMPDIDKLKHLYRDKRFPQRKKIIKSMIANGANPNEILYQGGETPLYESVVFEDLPFALFLLKHGATFDKGSIAWNPEFVTLAKEKAAENS